MTLPPKQLGTHANGDASASAMARFDQAMRDVQDAQKALEKAMKELSCAREGLAEGICCVRHLERLEPFPVRLVRLRAAADLTQQDLARASGVSIAQIGRYETGSSSPRAVAIAKLAKALNVSPADLAEVVDTGPGLQT